MKNIFLWITRGLLSLGFTMAGLGKFFLSERWSALFEKWGYFDGFYLVVGVLEVICAILILVPKTWRWSAYCLLVILTGATITRLLFDPWKELVGPAIYFSLIGAAFWLSSGISKRPTPS